MTILHLKRRCRLSENKLQISNVSKKKMHMLALMMKPHPKFLNPKRVEDSLPKNRWEAPQEGCSASPIGRDPPQVGLK